MNPIKRFVLLLVALVRKQRCPHNYHPWKGNWCICVRTYLHWGQHRGFLAPNALIRWKNTAIAKEPMKRASWWGEK